ncbi:energy-coupling factor ABC transporter substrate-binding protein [Microcoleus sp. FACHB-68]|uniref:energy-coupling factor ABC transporter substrate-binding protein n=1 Tax=Microcoleus sp. FACHB-68 TaxID=2692826 RepID=UPI00168A05AA|nr:energy-coupling factor ABC transporter substrate-binding protein [Microcoleus sp. FACHB-68]MBD1939772.1 energy-coupling factor ABC transporter substrate-binding protein [Microcoleus sp. FACHB-68]
MQQKQKAWDNWLLILGVVFLAAMPLILVKNSEFGGADGQAEEAIQEVQPDYKPWFEPVVELPGGEVESLLFAVQAAAGAGVIGYVIGLYRGRGFREVKSKK